jgi:hypothetical protein
VTATDRKAAVADAYRARLMPTLEAIAALGTAADEQGWMALGWPTDPVTPSFRDDTGDAVVVMRDDIRDLHYLPYVRLRCAKLDFDPVRVCIQMLGLASPDREPLDAPDPAFYRRHLEQLARARYVLIVVTHDVRMPRVEGATSFEGGMVNGAALLFEIETRTLRGAFEYVAINGDHLKGSDRTIEDKLRDDLEAQFSSAIIDGIARRFPDGRPPVTLGYV